MSAPDLICIGEPLVEFIATDGPDANTYLRGIGGDTSNAAIAAARHGARVGYVTALGADRFGDAIMQVWAREGIDASHVLRDSEASTGIYFIDPDPEGRFFTYYREGSAAARMSVEDLPLDYICSAGVLHLSGISLAISENLRKATLSAAMAVHGAGNAVSIDTNLRLKLWSAEEARAVIHEAMAYARIAITSIDDSLTLTGLIEPKEIISFYQALGPEIVIVTMGGEGCLIGSGDSVLAIPAAPAIPVDSTGAGDSFSGSFLARWIATGDVAASARYAAVVAARVVSGFGAVDAIPDAATVMAELDGR